MLETQNYNLIKDIVYIAAAIIPFYFLLKSRNASNNNNNNDFNNLRKINLILFVFILLQILYHFVEALGFRLLAKGFLEPLSMAALLFFGIIYIIITLRTKNRQQQQQSQQQEFKK